MIHDVPDGNRLHPTTGLLGAYGEVDQDFDLFHVLRIGPGVPLTTNLLNPNSKGLTDCFSPLLPKLPTSYLTERVEESLTTSHLDHGHGICSFRLVRKL